jgi:hypothetical protein
MKIIFYILLLSSILLSLFFYGWQMVIIVILIYASVLAYWLWFKIELMQNRIENGENIDEVKKDF